jgi:CRISPR-associated protein Cpf1
MNVETKTGTMVQYAITDCLKGLFEDIGVDLHGDIVKQVAMKQTKLHKKFFGSLAFYLHLLINTRSSVSGTDIDYINCPCCGFSSADEEGFRGVPFNGDANGAYNVARKGILVLKKLEKYKADNGNLEKMNWGDLFIDIEEWDKFSQSNN